jgi:hypothetical protein
MTKSKRLIGIALVGVAALLLPLTAEAACPTSLIFGGYYSQLTGTGAGLRANFWMMGAGNPALGAGNDNGAINKTGVWVQNLSANPVAFYGDWNTQAYDGCADAVQPISDQRMAASFSDVNAAGDMTFAVLCAHRDPPSAVQFNFDRPGNGPITLAPAQKAIIANTVRTGTEAAITIQTPNFSAGFYTDGSVGCEQAAVIPQFDVFKQQTARGVPPAPTNDATVGGPWVLVGTCNTSGSPACVVTTTCGAVNCDNFLAVVPHFNSNFSTGEASSTLPPRVSAKSGNVQAGPTLAVTPKPKKINNGQLGPKKVAGEQ